MVQEYNNVKFRRRRGLYQGTIKVNSRAVSCWGVTAYDCALSLREKATEYEVPDPNPDVL